MSLTSSYRFRRAGLVRRRETCEGSAASSDRGTDVGGILMNDLPNTRQWYFSYGQRHTCFSLIDSLQSLTAERESSRERLALLPQ